MAITDEDLQGWDRLLALEDDPQNPNITLRWYVLQKRGGQAPLNCRMPRRVPSALNMDKEEWEDSAYKTLSRIKHREGQEYMVRAISEDGQQLALARFLPPQSDTSEHLDMPTMRRGSRDDTASITEAVRAVIAPLEAKIGALEERLDDEEELIDDDRDGPGDPGLQVLSQLMGAILAQKQTTSVPHADTLAQVAQAVGVVDAIFPLDPTFKLRLGNAMRVLGNSSIGGPSSSSTTVGALPSATPTTDEFGLDLATYSRAVANLKAAGMPNPGAMLRAMAEDPHVARQIVAGVDGQASSS